jgi:Glycogen debranching enzyme N terminal
VRQRTQGAKKPAPDAGAGVDDFDHRGNVPICHDNDTVLGRDLTGHWDTASRREWLVANNLGGFAVGTVSGANTRRYHGLLVASLKPPVERTVLLAKVDLSLNYQGRQHELGANEFDGGVIHPKGYAHIGSFRLRGGILAWRYAIGDALLEQHEELSRRLSNIFLRDANGCRAVLQQHRSCSRRHISAIAFPSTSTSTATTAAASAPHIRPAGPRWSPSC